MTNILTDFERSILAGLLVGLSRKKPALNSACERIAKKLDIEASFKSCLHRQTALHFKEEDEFDPANAPKRKVRGDIL